MTTICYDGKHLAADSQVTSQGRTSFRYINKIVGVYSAKDQCNVMFSVAGGWFDYSVFEKYLLTGDDSLHEKLTNGFEGLVVYPDGSAKTYNDVLVSIDIKPPYTLGSGESYALAALYCGKDAKGAVEIASLLDVYTGGDINIKSVESLADASKV